MASNPTQVQSPGRRLAFRVTNAGLSALHVRVEPWAEEYDLSAGTTREFIFTGPDPADLEIEVKATEITIYGWTGSVLDG